MVAGARFRFPVSPPEEPRGPGSPSESPLLPRASRFQGSCRPARIKGTIFLSCIRLLVKINSRSNELSVAEREIR